MYAYAAAYTPDPDRPGKALLPFDTETGRLDGRGVGAVAGPGPRADGPALCRRAGLDAAHLPRRRAQRRVVSSISAPRRSRPSCTALGVAHTLELFDGRHGGISYRYPGAIAELVRALS